jgi:hypothetical protein
MGNKKRPRLIKSKNKHNREEVDLLAILDAGSLRCFFVDGNWVCMKLEPDGRRVFFDGPFESEGECQSAHPSQ